VVVISSTGKHFSAGMDLSVFMGGELAGQDAEAGRRHARLRSNAKVLQWSFTALEKARVPVLAAVQGGVIGGAVDLVTACDVRYASADAFFCVQEINIGMTPTSGTLQRIGKVVNEGFAREMAYTGRRYPRSALHEVGLVQQVYPTTTRSSPACSRRRGDRRQVAAGDLGHQGRDELRPRPRGSTTRSTRSPPGRPGMFQPDDMMEAFAPRARSGRRSSPPAARAPRL
jgi:enoyl-CoA hydratase